ncbi:DUF4124 domain-containing protein [Variovorax sp. CYS-02]|uniref:DUF4124 domain-containing protein n=2 Tax=Variovorax terrae TaxID=2923278 RepID=A0A9X1VX44_9BURK|nr:DUF4124 domain-containing protein [Variovorax terrae]MCJ0765416.1 DUF4124 domain-containing protein [Variovorax terrae]
MATAGLAIGPLLAGGWGLAHAQAIYSCVDGKGRKITADRPIAECVDREQKELNPSGTVRRSVGPTLTAQERAQQEEKDKKLAEERARQAEEKRRDRALLIRYPSKAVHDKERAEALHQVDQVIQAANKRIGELVQQRQSIDTEFEFYKKDPGKAPASLKRQVDENDHSMAVQKRFIADQQSEKQRVNARFDEELVKLRQLWALQGAPAAAAAPASEKK